MKRTIEQVKADATNMVANGDISGEEIRDKAKLVNFALTNEQVAFVMASTEDEISDANYIDLLTEAYTGTEQGVVDMAWNMTGFDGTPEEQVSMTPYYAAFEAANGRPINLSPNALWAVLTDPANQAEHETMDEWLDAIAEAEPEEDAANPPPVDTKAGQEAEASAFAIGDELAKDADLQSLLGKTADTSQFLKIAPVLLMQRIEKHFPPNEVDGDPILAWPVPGSKHKDGLAREGNQLFDRYKVTAGTKKRAVSFYGLIFSRFPEGIALNKELAEIAREDNGRYAVSPTTGWTVAKRNAEARTLTTRFNDQTKYFGNAVKLHKQLAWLKTYPGCEVEMDLDVDGSLRRTTTPFILTPNTGNPKADAKYAAPMTIGDVLRFDRDNAMTGIAGKPGGSWDALLETKKRIVSPEEAKAKLAEARKIVDAAIKAGTMKADGTLAPTAQATEVGLIRSIKQAESYIAAIAHLSLDLNAAEPDAPLSKDMAHAMTHNRDFVYSFRELIRLADAYRGRAETMIRRFEAEDKAKAGNGTQEAKTA